MRGWKLLEPLLISVLLQVVREVSLTSWTRTSVPLSKEDPVVYEKEPVQEVVCNCRCACESAACSPVWPALAGCSTALLIAVAARDWLRGRAQAAPAVRVASPTKDTRPRRHGARRPCSDSGSSSGGTSVAEARARAGALPG